MTSPIKLKSKKTMALLVCAVFFFCFIYTVSAQSSNTVVNAAASTTQPKVGSTLTVTITISNVQNLFGIDATLQWNSSILALSNVNLNLWKDSHTNGVLYGSINTDSNNIKPGDIYVNETKLSGSYELVAQSFGQNTNSFNGTGTIATLTFNVISSGPAGLSLQTDLADRSVGTTAGFIDHQDTAASVTAVASGSSSNTPSVPEFPSITIMTVVIAIAVAGIVLVTKKLSKNRILFKNTVLTVN
jgi:hypothetical protein